MLSNEYFVVLGELVATQDREWFRANRDRIRTACEQPMRALLEAVLVEAESLGVALPMGDVKLFRLARDTRFSQGQPPYKEHVAGVIPLLVGSSASAMDVRAAPDAPAVMYLQIGLEERFSAAGIYGFPPAVLRRYRERVLDEATGRELVAIVAGLKADGYRIGGASQLKRAPAGVSPEHPRIELLRWKGLVAVFPDWRPGAELKPAFVRRLAEHIERTAALTAWLGACVAEAAEATEPAE